MVRAGHTEAAVDISRLAGLNPSGVICEIMNDDGTMARLPDLVDFAKTHKLKIGTISDLIAYRRQYDKLVTQTGARKITSVHGGEWDLQGYTELAGGAEHVVITQGDVTDGKPVLVRMHSANPFDDLLAEQGGKHGELHASMDIIGKQGRGVVVIFRDLGMHLTQKPKSSPEKIRQYGVGAQILRSLGVRDMILLTNSGMPSVVGLDAYNLNIVDTHPIKVSET
ncbi:MAG: hypothetical protein COB84_08945 [Rhodobacteraceae bacterium]|nr:MAG: hypothetical protein COB84_08945 [Paracoccaceae bacterium]